MMLLSGDHATSPSGALVWVIRRGGFSPSTGTNHRSLMALSGSYAGSSTEYTIHLPSGLAAGAPTRFIIQSASCVIGLREGDDWATEAIGAARHAVITSGKNRTCFIGCYSFCVRDQQNVCEYRALAHGRLLYGEAAFAQQRVPLAGAAAMHGHVCMAAEPHHQPVDPLTVAKAQAAIRVADAQQQQAVGGQCSAHPRDHLPL